ncbi:VWA domain-containing protein [Roseobacter sp. A03A-229]
MTRVLILMFCLVFGGSQLAAQPQKPLLVEGKQTTFQRVLTKPGAALRAEPDGRVDRQYPAFQPLYVFARQDDWIQVGPSASRAPEGWLSAPEVVTWKQNIVGAFSNSAGRKRQMLFENEDRLRWLMGHEALAQVQDQLLAEIAAGISDGSKGVVAAEPEEFVNIRNDLYIMPILDFEQDFSPINYDTVLLMEVASVPLREEKAQPVQTTTSTDEFDVGIVFVLDTTQSMEPYIARTQKALSGVVAQIQGTEVGELVNFGAWAFRDDNTAVEGLEYRTKELIPLARRSDQAPVLDAIGSAAVSQVSSPGFNEDSIAGVEDAINLSDWDQGGDPINARYVILVTDAGPKDPRDPNARSQIGPAELQVDAEGRQIVVMTLHLETEVGGPANHAYAAEKYRDLSKFGDSVFYFPIAGGSEDVFEDVTTRLVTALTDHVRVALGEATTLAPEEAGEDLVELGRAMQLAYLGAKQGTQAPDVIRGWVTDKAVEDPRKTVIEPRLLMTKNEMATMAQFVKRLADEADKITSRDEALGFFDSAREIVTQMAADPKIVIDAGANDLGGALEFLEDLPYQSQLMSMTPERFTQSAPLRRQITDTFRQKVAQYQKWLVDPSVWTSLYEGSPDGEHVFAMPFKVLP